MRAAKFQNRLTQLMSIKNVIKPARMAMTGGIAISKPRLGGFSKYRRGTPKAGKLSVTKLTRVNRKTRSAIPKRAATQRASPERSGRFSRLRNPAKKEIGQPIREPKNRSTPPAATSSWKALLPYQGLFTSANG